MRSLLQWSVILLATGAAAQDAVPQDSPPSTEVAQPAAQAPAPAGRTVTGRVVDAQTGRPLAGATVTFDTTPVIAVDADEQGRFRADGVPDEQVTVRGYAMDYVTEDLVLPAGVTELTVRLASGFSEEIVVVGRATDVARKNLANAVSTVKGSELTNGAPAQTVESALQGKVAGANIQSNGGAPGGGLQLKLRGVSTINGRSDPLYVVDGVIVSDTAIPNGISAVTKSSSGSNASSTQDAQVNRIADINPEDIENIEILKGASAAAIYGSKASNGVVIITTKRGRSSESNEPAINFAQRVGVYQLSNKLGTRRFNSAEEAESVWGAAGRDAYTGAFYDHEEQLAGGLAPARETSLSATGSLNQGRTTYYASGLLRDDEGIVERTGYEKQSLRVNLTQKVGERAEVRVNTNLTHSLAARGISNNDNSGTSHYVVFASTPSFMNLGAAGDGTYPLNPFIGAGTNPLQTAAMMQNDEDVWRMLGSATLEWKLFKSDDDTQSLTFFSDFGMDRFQQKNTLLFPPELNFEPVDDGLPGTSLFATSENLNLNGGVNLVHSYKPQGSALNSATTSAGVQLEQRGLDTLYLVARNLNAGMPNVDSGTNQNATQRRNKIRDRGVYIQEELLMLDERLTLAAALRGEQSSVNGDVNKLYLYPKVATAYRLQVLPSVFNEFKLRAAYGQTGNQPLYGMKFSGLNATGNIEGQPGLVGTGIAGDPNIRPERQHEVELGMDLVALDGDAYFEFTVYQRNISDLLLQRAVAPSTGYLTQFVNGGNMRNRGVELAVQVAPVRREALRWDTRATFSLNRSLITSLPEEFRDRPFNVGGFGTSLGAFRIQEKRSATQIVGNAGLGADGRPNVVQLGDTEPDFRMSFSNTLQLGGFRAHLLMDWLQGSSIINLTRFLYDDRQNTPDFEAGAARAKAWSEDLLTATYIEDGSFLKVRELSVSYDLPKTWYQGMVPGVKSARLAISGRNLLTFTNYSGLDPEVSNFGNQAIARNIDVAPYPPSRSYWGSIELGF
jgi:TonB-dependent starch-binding outer membrane protein SusC